VFIYDFGLFFCGLGRLIILETQDFLPGDDKVGLPNIMEGFGFSTLFVTYRLTGDKTLNLLGEGDQLGLFENVLFPKHKNLKNIYNKWWNK